MTSNIRPYLHSKPVIGNNVFIDPTAVIIGDVRISNNVSIWPLTVIRGDVNYISIGARTNIQDGSVLHVTHKNKLNPQGYPLIIGEDVTIGHKVMLHGCTIGNRTLVGMGSIILDGAKIETNVVIGAGSLVTQGKKLESGYLYIGSPVKQIRKLSSEELEGLVQSATNYDNWKNNYL